MAFIGNNLGSITTEIRTVDTMVGDGTTATLTLTKTPGSVNNVEVFYDGIFQTPGEDFTLAGNIITFTTAPTTGINVRAISGDDSQVVFPDANSITTKKILDNTITSDKFVDVAVEKLSGTLPAVDGSAVTGINLPDAVDVTTSASNPTRTTNKPVGSLAVNSTSGEMFICTDAETDNNTWMNVGLGNADVVYTPPLPFGGLGGGTVSGFAMGGSNNPTGVRVIDKISLTSDGNIVDMGDLTIGRYTAAGHSSATHAFISGGNTLPTQGFRTDVDKILMANATTSSDHGDLVSGRAARNGVTGTNSSTDGYTSGGDIPPHPSMVNFIDKFSFSSNTNATDHGDMFRSSMYCGGISSNTHGYNVGGWIANGAFFDIIEKFNFVSNTTATNIGTLSIGRQATAAASGPIEGFVHGGWLANVSQSSIDKFSYSSDSITGNVGNINLGRQSHSGLSSTTHGYSCGGYSSIAGDTIGNVEKYSFDSLSVTNTVTTLTVARHSSTGHQY